MIRTRIAITLALVLLGAVAPAAHAADTWQAVGPAIGPADPSAGGFDLKRIAGAPTVAYAHWNGTNHEIRVVRYESEAWKPLGTQVNADPAHDATRPSLASGPGGVPWVTWIEVGDDGVRQIRAARYSASKNRFVEPVGGDWPIQPRHHGDPRDAWIFAGISTQIVFVGSRPHIHFIVSGMSDYTIGIARLSADRRSWRFLPTPSPRSSPSSFRAAVLGGVLHTTFDSRLDGAPLIDRLTATGWEQVGGRLDESTPEPHDEGSGGSLAEKDGVPYAAWTSGFGDTGLVARLQDGHWRQVGGDLGGTAGDLRLIGGRLWVTVSNGGLRAAKLADDASSWQATATIPAAVAGPLTGIVGVPHVGWLDADGRVHVSRLLGATAVGGDDNDGSASPCPNAGIDITESVLAPPPPAEWPQPGSSDNPSTDCSMADHVPADGDPPGTDPPGRKPPGPNPPGPNPPRADPPKPGPCGFRMLGTPAGDKLLGDELRNEIAGRAGNDTIHGLGGGDCLFGNAGNDVIKGGPGADRLEGGSGNDRLVGGDGDDSVKAGPGNDVVDSRGKGRDEIDCGPGRADKALVGDLDRVRNCERVLNVD